MISELPLRCLAVFMLVTRHPLHATPRRADVSPADAPFVGRPLLGDGPLPRRPRFAAFFGAPYPPCYWAWSLALTSITRVVRRTLPPVTLKAAAILTLTVFRRRMATIPDFPYQGRSRWKTCGPGLGSTGGF